VARATTAGLPHPAAAPFHTSTSNNSNILFKEGKEERDFENFFGIKRGKRSLFYARR